MNCLKTRWILIAAMVSGIGLTSAIAGPKGDEAKKSEEPARPLCPVMGNPVNFTASMMTDDGPIYVCCPGCFKKLKAEPKKYAAKVAEQRKALAKMSRVQVNCPISGKPIDKAVSAEKDGETVSFCCPDCISRYEKDPTKYKAKLAASYTYQAKCPVTGKPIDPTAFTTLKNGQNVYFNCTKCIPKFLATPEKFLPNLAKQGYPIDPKAVSAKAEKEQEGHEGHDHSSHGH